MYKLLVGLVVGIVAGAGSFAVAQTTTVTSADFCVKENGQLRLAVDGTCGPTEELLTIAGEQGPPGNDGADGQDGVDGTDGVDGVDGTDGQDGADGVSGYEIVSFDPVWSGGGGFRSLDLSCPPGKKVLGSGWRRQLDWSANLIDSYPVNESTWRWMWNGPGFDFDGEFPHYIICADA